MTQLKNVGSMCCLTFAVTGGSLNQRLFTTKPMADLNITCHKSSFLITSSFRFRTSESEKNRGNTKISEGISAYITLNHKTLY